MNLLANLFPKPKNQIPTPESKSESRPEPEPLDFEDILTVENIKSYFVAKEYKFFDTPNKELNLNLVGVRRDNLGTNTYDDYLLLMYRKGDEVTCNRYSITTDPGKYWLENPINPAGTAVLVPDQYRGTWKLGKHQNRYEALVQRKPVKVYRDNNRDDVMDYENEVLVTQEGYFGINIHRSNPYGKSYSINKWSAGCQVFGDIHQYKEFLSICKESSEIYGDTFTYTLITEKELRNHLDS